MQIHNTPIRLFLFSIIVTTCFPIGAQVYIEKQSRHRFAQLNLGGGIQMSSGGHTSYIDQNGNSQKLSLKNTYSPTFIIGGTHFWGHADFAITVPLFAQTVSENNQNLQYLRGVETAFKFYPWRITKKKIRPYLGVSLAPFYYEQNNENLEFGSGHGHEQVAYPILGGLTYSTGSKLIELGITWNYQNTQDYYITKEIELPIETPPLFFHFSFRHQLETTVSAEKDWESGETEKLTQQLADEGKLNRFYIGAGLSSAFWMGSSTYNEVSRPFIDGYNTSIMPDINVGYYFHKPDMNVNIAFRSYKTSTRAYGTIQNLKRRAFTLEAAKYLFDYHGFAPFLGPNLSLENLTFRESYEGNLTHDITESKVSYGLTFGWDIRPNRIQTWLLRTNLRWSPNLGIDVDSERTISFNNIEFNFIQLNIFLNRLYQ